MPDISITANGVRMQGWSTAYVRRSLDVIADEFSFELTNQRVNLNGTVSSTGLSRKAVQTAADQLSGATEIAIDIDGELLVTGYLDDFSFDYDAHKATMKIGGRSKAGDLNDCSAERKTQVWTKATLYDIARDLSLPFGITVTDASNLAGKPFQRFRLEHGETAFEAIGRAAEKRQVMVVSSPDGNIELVTAAEKPSGATLQLGTNIISATYRKTLRDRFSVYKFRGQTSADDDWNGTKASQLKGEIVDDKVGRYRPMLVNNGKAKSGEDLGARAIWERNVRAGRSIRYGCTVEEWTALETGKPWAPNQLVYVKDPWAGVDQSMLVASVEFTLNAHERLTHLDLVDRSAFVPNKSIKLPKVDDGGAQTPANLVGNLFGVGRPPDK